MFYLLYKPPGISSFSAIKKFARENNIKKVGHTGTLDPLASGLLLIASDEDTKLIQYIANKNKAYIVKGFFGQRTDTYDIEGKILEESQSKVTEKEFKNALKILVTKKEQIPPIFSAKKINGKKAYEYARNNQEISLKAQKIEIFDYKVIYFDYNNQNFSIYFNVSEGAYIRTLINDLGILCNNFATMSALERTEIASYSIELLNNEEFIDVDSLALFNLATFSYSEEQKKLLKDGRSFVLNNANIDGKILLLNANKQIAGVAEINDGLLKPKKLFLKRL